jgi:hypothetical protein
MDSSMAHFYLFYKSYNLEYNLISPEYLAGRKIDECRLESNDLTFGNVHE